MCVDHCHESGSVRGLICNNFATKRWGCSVMTRMRCGGQRWTTLRQLRSRAFWIQIRKQGLMVGLETLFSTLASRVAHSLQGQLQTQLRNAVNQVQSFSANTPQQSSSSLQASKFVERVGQFQNPFHVAQQAFSQRWSQYRAQQTSERLYRAKEVFDREQTPESGREYARAMRANDRAEQKVQQAQGQYASCRRSCKRGDSEDG